MDKSGDFFWKFNTLEVAFFVLDLCVGICSWNFFSWLKFAFKQAFICAESSVAIKVALSIRSRIYEKEFYSFFAIFYFSLLNVFVYPGDLVKYTCWLAHAKVRMVFMCISIQFSTHTWNRSFSGVLILSAYLEKSQSSLTDRNEIKCLQFNWSIN